MVLSFKDDNKNASWLGSSAKRIVPAPIHKSAGCSWEGGGYLKVMGLKSMI